MKKKSFGEKIKFSFRKMAISLKRNFYVVPLALVLVTCMQFLCSLYILSPMFARIPTKFGSFNCLFLFVITLLSILYCVAYMNYALKKYGKKRPLFMLILYFVMWAINIVLLFMIFNANNLDLAEEIAAYDSATTESEKVIYAQYVTLGQQSRTCLLAQIILAFISFASVALAPLIQHFLKKITFKPIDTNYEKENQENK